MSYQELLINYYLLSVASSFLVGIVLTYVIYKITSSIYKTLKKRDITCIVAEVIEEPTHTARQQKIVDDLISGKI